MKALLAALMAGVMTIGMAGCGASGSGSEGDGGDDKTITIWATGSDNVRTVYESLIDDFK